MSNPLWSALRDNVPMIDLCIDGWQTVGEILKDPKRDPAEVARLIRVVFDRVSHALSKNIKPDEVRNELAGLRAAVADTAAAVDARLDKLPR